MKIGIVGHGFVGKAVDYGFPHNMCQKTIIDPIYGNSISDLGTQDFTFVCVPTPMGTNGCIDSSIITSVMCELRKRSTGIVIIKSTVTPDIIQNLWVENYSTQMVYNPEFLTEKSANEDFVNPTMHVFGGTPAATDMVEHLYKFYSLCKPCPTYHMSPVDASFVKYGINSFLASKVLWFNQFHDVVNKYGSNFGKVIGAITADTRVGRSHTTVPGFDGKRGFGGACFPKDTAALAHFANGIGVEFSVLEEIINSNNEYRKSYEKDTREIEQNIKFSNTFGRNTDG
jgi:nucleotide sugar dehydrogenase